MAFTEQEKQIIKFGIDNGKSKDETRQALINFRTATKKTDVEKNEKIEQPGFFQRVGGIIKGAGEKVRQAIEGEEEFAGETPIRRGVEATSEAFKTIPAVALETLPKKAREAVGFVGKKIASGFDLLTDKVASTKLFKEIGELEKQGYLTKEIAPELFVLKEALGTSQGLGNISDVILATEGVAKSLQKTVNLSKEVFKNAKTIPSKSIDFIKTKLKDKAQIALENNAKKEIDSILNNTKGIQNKVKIAKQGGTDLRETLSDQSIYQGIKVEGGRILPDEAIQTIRNRTDALLEAKRNLIPDIDNYVKDISRDVIRKRAIENLKGTPADIADDVVKINKQIDALPERLKGGEVDSFRSQVRKSARDVKGLAKTNEYYALEKASRDTFFEMADNLPFDTTGQMAEISDYIKKMIATEEFLDRTLRGQIVKGGRLGKYTGRIIGAVSGSGYGLPGSILGSELGGLISDILTNTKLGNSIKIKLIGNITDNPEILKMVNDLLEKAEKYTPKALPPGSGIRRTEIVPGITKIPPSGSKTGKYEFIERK